MVSGFAAHGKQDDQQASLALQADLHAAVGLAASAATGWQQESPGQHASAPTFAPMTTVIGQHSGQQSPSGQHASSEQQLAAAVSTTPELVNWDAVAHIATATSGTRVATLRNQVLRSIMFTSKEK
jgi:hypothetical protein